MEFSANLRLTKTMKKIILFFLSFIIVPFAHAAIIDRITIEDKIIDDFVVMEKVVIGIKNNTDDAYLIKLPPNAKDAIINSKNGSSNKEGYIIPLNCSECQISIAYYLEKVLDTDNNIHNFFRTLNLPSPNHLNYTVVLPKGYTLKENANIESVVPAPASINSDGINIRVNWVEKDASLPKAYYIVYTHSHDFDSGNKSIPQWIFTMALAGVVILILAVIGLVAYSRHLKEKRMAASVPISVFTPDEKQVIHLLKSHKNELRLLKMNPKPITQKEAGAKLNWSKSKTSAVMTGLEYKKVIEREKFGRNFRVNLKSDVVETSQEEKTKGNV